MALFSLSGDDFVVADGLVAADGLVEDGLVAADGLVAMDGLIVADDLVTSSSSDSDSDSESAVMDSSSMTSSGSSLYSLLPSLSVAFDSNPESIVSRYDTIFFGLLLTLLIVFWVDKVYGSVVFVITLRFFSEVDEEENSACDILLLSLVWSETFRVRSGFEVFSFVQRCCMRGILEAETFLSKLEKSCFVLIPFIDTSPSELMRSSILISLVRVISRAGALSCG